MKKITLIFLLITLSTVGFGQNLLVNPNFVDGSNWSETQTNVTSGWDGTDTQTADGSGSYNLVNNGTYNTRISQDIAQASVAATDYILSFWVKGDAGIKVRGGTRDNGTNVNGIWTGDGTSDIYTIQAADTWEYAEFQIPVSGLTNVNVRIFNRANVDGVAVKIDDVSFTQAPLTGNTLTVNTVGSGDVNLTLGKTSYDPADVETLEAIPATHWDFDNWSGDLTSATNPETLLMDADKTVTANFIIDPTFNYAFTFDTDGELEGWSTDASLSIDSHTGGLVTLAVTADSWSRFNLQGFPIPSGTYDKVTISLQNNTTNDELGFIVDDGSPEVITKTMSTNNTGIQSYEFDLTQFTKWTGDVNYVRIRFSDADNPNAGKPLTSGTIIIDKIEFSTSVLGVNRNNFVKFKLFPNPTNNSINIEGLANIAKVEVYNLLGKKLINTNSLESNKLDLSALSNGMYLVLIEDINHSIAVKKVIKK